MTAGETGERELRAPVERPITVYVNDEEWLTVQVTPQDLHDWAVGFLCGEGVTDESGGISRLVVEEDCGVIWVDLPASRRKAESTFAPVAPGAHVTDQRLLRWMGEMLADAPLYRSTGGMHAAMAVRADTDERFVREDVGRHNALDKALGAARKAGWPAGQVAVLTTGRISYEMCTRLARYGAGIGASRTAVTDMAYSLAMELGIELVGHVRNATSLIVYTRADRVERKGEAGA